MKNLKICVVGPLALLLATQLSGCSASAGIQPSTAVCTQYLQKMQMHQPAAAYGLLSSKCKSAMTQQQMQNIWDYIAKSHGKIKSWSQTGVKIYSGTTGNYVNLSYSIACTNSASAVLFSCKEENNNWRIEGFNIK